MASRHDEDRGFATSFGTGGLPFDVAHSRETWSWGKSVFIMLLGLAGVVIGILDGRTFFPIFCGGLALLGAVWLIGSWRAARSARRLERRDLPSWPDR